MLPLRYVGLVLYRPYYSYYYIFILMVNIPELIADNLSLPLKSVAATIRLLDGGATIPFIARYRKEMTGGLDEVEIGNISQEQSRLIAIQKHKTVIIEAIDAAGALTDEIRRRILSSWNETELEDIYMPYKQKRRTRATAAKEAGLEPLAKILMSGRVPNPIDSAERFVSDSIPSPDVAISGAQDIIAEWVSESEAARGITRRIFYRNAIIHSRVVKGKEEDGGKYRDYFDKRFKLSQCPSHALLAMRRGEAEKILRVTIEVEQEQVLDRLNSLFIKSGSTAAEIVKKAVKDGYKRLLCPSIETEFAGNSKYSADTEAIRIFAGNLRQLLLAAPLGQKRTMGIDPGFRTGCKIVCLDAQGTLLYNDTIFPHPPCNDKIGAECKIRSLVERYDIEAIAIGNGTAGRETEEFVRCIRFTRNVKVYVCNESGASIYSASSVAREEFPDYDITVRGAVSIARRLMDPLAELVKIDPKSIGVGQYQHDVDQSRLKQALDRTVESCVNLVGVEINSASKQLLTYVSGVGPVVAQNIVDYRNQHGPFHSRQELLDVPKLGPKTYEQCAGFIRVGVSDNPLDRSAVHPERYALVGRMANDLGVTVEDLMSNEDIRLSICLEKYITAEIGMSTLRDILSELEKPGRDPRQAIDDWSFDTRIKTIEDLYEGMRIDGIVTNITNFGAFVNIGIKENALLHVSQISDRRIVSPEELLHINQHLTVTVLSVDIPRRRIQLTLKN